MANPKRSRTVEKGGKFGENHFSGKMYIPFDAGCQMNMQLIGFRLGRRDLRVVTPASTELCESDPFP